MDNQKSITGLLPKYFKIIGLIFILLAFVPMLLLKELNVELNPVNKEWNRVLMMDAFILGLVCIVWARDKFEDDRTIALRLKTIGFSFIFGVFTVIVDPLSSLFFGLSEPVVSGHSLMVSMLLFYLLMYYVQRMGKR